MVSCAPSQVIEKIRTGVDPGIPEPEFEGRKLQRDTLVINKPGDYDFHNVLHVWSGRKWPRDREYGPPALQVMVSGVTVRNFAVSGAPDGIHVGSLRWSADNATRRAREVREVRFVNLRMIDIREDAFTCQMGTRDITIDGSAFWGGSDKVIQNDHGRNLRIHDCRFYRGTRCIRWKANTTGEVLRCTFIECDYPVKCDGNPWPEDAPRRRRRPGGRVHVKVRENVFYRAKVAIEAGRDVVIDEGDNRFVQVRVEKREVGNGRIG